MPLEYVGLSNLQTKKKHSTKNIYFKCKKKTKFVFRSVAVEIVMTNHNDHSLTLGNLQG